MDEMAATALTCGVRKELGLVGSLSRAVPAASSSGHPLNAPPLVAKP
jgi:hypothetical protein